jgi:16S rRNA C1402 (ribose-2'-O) methylase RsmI
MHLDLRSEELQADKEQMREEAHRMQQIIMALSQKIPEPPQESVVLKELTGATQEVKEKTVRGITKWMRRFSR